MRLSIVGAVAICAMLGACAQQEEEAPVIQGQPTYDKFGGINGCEEGVYIPGAAPPEQCLPPEECEETIDATGQTIPCPPPPVRFGDGDDDRGRQPVGTVSLVRG